MFKDGIGEKSKFWFLICIICNLGHFFIKNEKNGFRYGPPAHFAEDRIKIGTSPLKSYFPNKKCDTKKKTKLIFFAQFAYIWRNHFTIVGVLHITDQEIKIQSMQYRNQVTGSLGHWVTLGHFLKISPGHRVSLADPVLTRRFSGSKTGHLSKLDAVCFKELPMRVSSIFHSNQPAIIVCYLHDVCLAHYASFMTVFQQWGDGNKRLFGRFWSIEENWVNRVTGSFWVTFWRKSPGQAGSPGQRSFSTPGHWVTKSDPVSSLKILFSAPRWSVT